MQFIQVYLVNVLIQYIETHTIPDKTDFLSHLVLYNLKKSVNVLIYIEVGRIDLLLDLPNIENMSITNNRSTSISNIGGSDCSVCLAIL